MSGMARAAAAASRSEEEKDARHQWRLQQKREHGRQQRQKQQAASVQDGNADEEESEGGESEDELERRVDDWVEAGQPGYEFDARVSPCPHGCEATDDWCPSWGEGNPMRRWSSHCGDCAEKRAADEAEWAAAEAAAAASGPPDDDDPYGGASADCFYDIGSGDRKKRRLAGGLAFSLPGDAGTEQPGDEPVVCTPSTRKRSLPADFEDRGPDWAPAVTAAAPGGEPKLHAKGSDFYTNFEAAVLTSFSLMQHNGAHGDPDGTALHKWLNAEYLPHESPKPPPFNKPPPKRCAYPHGEEGANKFRDERAEWYRRVTASNEHPEGLTLKGSLTRQNFLFDIIARRYRSYSDRVSQRVPAQGECGCDVF